MCPPVCFSLCGLGFGGSCITGGTSAAFGYSAEACQQLQLYFKLLCLATATGNTCNAECAGSGR